LFCVKNIILTQGLFKQRHNLQEHIRERGENDKNIECIEDCASCPYMRIKYIEHFEGGLLPVALCLKYSSKEEKRKYKKKKRVKKPPLTPRQRMLEYFVTSASQI